MYIFKNKYIYVYMNMNIHYLCIYMYLTNLFDFQAIF